ncbi:hypothetical protein [Polynucleobacter sp.]|nr:hypothetical protein [Polynucleobacter sp.]MDP3121088.1 hypothetical protein [Polynucleobacter sp.]
MTNNEPIAIAIVGGGAAGTANGYCKILLQKMAAQKKSYPWFAN